MNILNGVSIQNVLLKLLLLYLVEFLEGLLILKLGVDVCIQNLGILVCVYVFGRSPTTFFLGTSLSTFCCWLWACVSGTLVMTQRAEHISNGIFILRIYLLEEWLLHRPGRPHDSIFNCLNCIVSWCSRESINIFFYLFEASLRRDEIECSCLDPIGWMTVVLLFATSYLWMLLL